MKGLLLKDLYTLKGYAKQYGILLILISGWAVFMKNMSFLVIYAIILGGMLLLSTLTMDEAVHFDRWTVTTPIGAKGMVQEKYALLFLAEIAGIAAGFLLHLIMVKLFDCVGAFAWEGLLITAAVFLGAYAVMLPVNFKMGVEKARYVYIGTTFSMVAALVGAFRLLERLGISPENLVEASPVLKIAVIVFCVLTYAVSYAVSLKVVKNREWQ